MDDPATATLTTCIAEIRDAAQVYSPLEIKVRTGRVSPRIKGLRTAKLGVTIRYRVQGGVETREAVVSCSVDPEGRVTITEVPGPAPAPAQ